MDGDIDIILNISHETLARSLIEAGAGSEAAGYMLFGTAEIEADPWTGNDRTRLVSHEFRHIEDKHCISASPKHVTWSTDGFMGLLGDASNLEMVPGIVHTHPMGIAEFSEQDDRNEAELARTALIKGVPALVSIVIDGNGGIGARVWRDSKTVPSGVRILHSGPRIALTNPETKTGLPTFLDRQTRLFGEAATDVVGSLRCAIAGGGATGSASLTLLMHLGIQNVVMFEKDIVEETNLNRLHGARLADVQSCSSKLKVHGRTAAEAGLMRGFVGIDGWAGEEHTHDALKSCDVIFSCTDDHAGRLFLNRFARFYSIPVIDVGLAMQRRDDDGFDLFARVSTLVAGHGCLLCGSYIDPRRAREENLKRADPEEFQRRKEEAYVLGERDPAPAVVTFTTEAAGMAVNELLSGITGFRSGGMVPTRIRRFHVGDERVLETPSNDGCPACSSKRTLGRADMTPFLDMVA